MDMARYLAYGESVLPCLGKDAQYVVVVHSVFINTKAGTSIAGGTDLAICLALGAKAVAYARAILASSAFTLPSLRSQPVPRRTSSALIFAAFAISATVIAFSAAERAW